MMVLPGHTGRYPPGRALQPSLLQALLPISPISQGTLFWAAGMLSMPANWWLQILARQILQ